MWLGHHKKPGYISQGEKQRSIIQQTSLHLDQEIMRQHLLSSAGACIGLLVLALTQLPTSSADRERRQVQIPCNHPLRIARPGLFAHCDSVCAYSTWSSWTKVPNSVVSVPPGKCPSGEAYTEERTRTATGNGCTEAVRETQAICK